MMIARTLCLAAALASTVAVAADASLPKVRMEKPGDSCEVQAVVAQKGEPDVLLTFRSERGIGRATIERQGAAWPERLRFRFEYTGGRSFEHLEGFRLHSDKAVVEGSLGSDTLRLRRADADGKFPPEHEAVELKAAPKHQHGTVEVDLPTEEFKESNRIELQWIDLYR